ncbi:GntR family transcriptional regulator [Halobacillus shinanisalinarum]|uniref:GntR family transcriptional regulator n=1 Tax=Halobacillus shinanisalinarum TaxID=2932258 RepID=A0ABY4H6T8_9BACI|nr:GntR family transcriptional regulator [Halobacillus shinanisalinarum]UOQ94702.1 GntR family transcriptional regulator [Halobacillus shinanisalinarum]
METIHIPTDQAARIIDDMMQKIMMKSFEPGAKLPSENALAEEYRVPRATVRNALTKLEERGYIYSKQGKGRYLKEESIQIELHLTGKISFTDKMKRLGYDLKTRNIYCEKISYDAKIYQLLQVKQGEDVYKIGRMRYIQNEPIALHNSFVSTARFPMVAEDGPHITSMFSYYRQHGYKEFDSHKTLLSTTFPTLYEQELLSCNSMVPLIIVESDCIDLNSKKVLEHTKILYRSDRFKYDITSV